MRKVILQEFVALDGRASGLNDSTDFIPASTQGDRSFGDWQTAFLDTLDTILMGRVTYELFASFWPNVTSGEDKPFADKLNAMRRVVFSNTLERAPWGNFEDAQVVRGNPSDEVAKLRQQSGKNMVVWGSLSLARSLMKDGQIDDVQLVMCPVVLGEGKPLFQDRIDPDELRLVNTRSYDRGAVLLEYAPLRSAR
jgi:dihydrofolate reductase